MKLSKSQKALLRKYLKNKLVMYRGYEKTNEQYRTYVKFLEVWLDQLN